MLHCCWPNNNGTLAGRQRQRGGALKDNVVQQPSAGAGACWHQRHNAKLEDDTSRLTEQKSRWSCLLGGARRAPPSHRVHAAATPVGRVAPPPAFPAPPPPAAADTADADAAATATLPSSFSVSFRLRMSCRRLCTFSTTASSEASPPGPPPPAFPDADATSLIYLWRRRRRRTHM